MVVDITSVSVLENMYNMLTELKTLERVFFKAGKEGNRALV